MHLLLHVKISFHLGLNFEVSIIGSDLKGLSDKATYILQHSWKSGSDNSLAVSLMNSSWKFRRHLVNVTVEWILKQLNNFLFHVKIFKTFLKFLTQTRLDIIPKTYPLGKVTMNCVEKILQLSKLIDPKFFLIRLSFFLKVLTCQYKSQKRNFSPCSFKFRNLICEVRSTIKANFHTNLLSASSGTRQSCSVINMSISSRSSRKSCNTCSTSKLHNGKEHLGKDCLLQQENV